MSDPIYTPAWKDSGGNRIVFVGPPNAMECSGLAHAKLIIDYPFFRQFGLEMDGVQKIDVDERGDYSFPHVKIKLWSFDGQCVAGPVFDEASQ
jgi:hypothetical protein